MRQRVLQTLTWATVSGAVASAFWLAAADLGWAEGHNPLAVPDAAFRLALPEAMARMAVPTTAADGGQARPRAEELARRSAAPPVR